MNLSLLAYTYQGQLGWLNDLYGTLPYILYGILACVGGAGMVYAIILGINLAKSESEDQRKNASNRIKNTIIGIIVLLALVLFINLGIPEILHAIYPTLVT